jgi:DegV family protein with EDD domain
MSDESVCILVDSACDLSAEFIASNHIKIIPIAVHFTNQVFVDRRDEAETLSLYRQEFNRRGLDADTVPFGADEIRHLLTTRIAPRYRGALLLTITASSCPVFENARKALSGSAGRLNQARLDAGRNGYFQVRLMDTETQFTGQAIVAHEAVKLVRENKLAVNQLTVPLQRLARKIYAYLIPHNASFLYRRAGASGTSGESHWSRRFGRLLDIKPIFQSHRGENSTVMKASGFDAALKKLLEHAMRQIKQGLAKPLVVISYAGDLDDIRQGQLIREFTDYAEHHGVEVMLSVMSAAAAVTIGSGALSLAFAAA